MERLIPLISKLQEIFFRTKVPFDIDYPQIVVVGGQSSGKSSVLESIVGRDFLPRGTNIVTRRPIHIQLINTPHASRDWCEFFHKPGDKYYDFHKVREEIESDTDRVCGRNKDISSVQIMLKIYSARVVDLTLIDLPGTTQNPVGDQPQDVSQKINDLCMQYCMPKNTIIMAICPANQDLSTCESLRIARRCDQNGERTIGVLTKIDIMDEGTNALEIIKGNLYPLKLGFVPVVCRSQKDILEGKKISDAIENEQLFFSQNEDYKVYRQRTGVKFLCQKLNEEIVRLIKKSLPTIRSKIMSTLYQKEKELATMEVTKGAGNMQQLILNVIAKYAKQYEEFIEGKFVKDTAYELRGGSRLNYIFYDVYTRAVTQIDPFDALSDDDIKTAIRNASSLRPNLFVPEQAFEILSKQQIKRLESPSLQCVQLVFEELRKIVIQIEMPELNRFQGLRKKINEVMLELLGDCLKPTNLMVKNLVLLQDQYINTYHPDFMGGANSVFGMFDPKNQNQPGNEPKSRMNMEVLDAGPIQTEKEGFERQEFQKQPFRQNQDGTQTPQKSNNYTGGEYINSMNNYEVNKFMQKDIKPIHMPQMAKFKRADDNDPGQSSPRSNMETNIIKNLIVSYFNTVRKTMNDMVPKTIMAFLVNKSKNTSQRELIQKIYADGQNLDVFLEEDSDTKQRREKTQNLVKTLRSSLEFLSEVRDFYFEENKNEL